MKKRWLILFMLLPVFTACGNWLAEDVTPPPTEQVVLPSPSPKSIGDALYPLVPPSISNGLEIYQDNCEACHGELGFGDGEKAADLPNPVTAIGSDEIARQSSPADWYRIISEGNIERFMPPFNSLDTRAKWDVVAYIFSLSTTEEEQDLGYEVYQEYCAECHGETGNGEGTRASDLQLEAKDLFDLEYLSGATTAEIFSVISSGKGEAMPGFTGQLNEQERWAASEYIRMLTFTGSDRINETEITRTESEAVAPMTASEDPTQADEIGDATIQDGIGTVTGSVANFTTGDTPAGIEITLFGFDQMMQVYTATTVVEDDGYYSFADVIMPPGRVFMVTADYQGITYGSDIATVQGTEKTLDIPISVYETTTEPNGLVADRLHLFYELVDESTLRVVELFVISNRGTETLIAEEDGEPVIEFSLPEGAVSLEIQDGEIGDGRYIKTENGFADTVSISPGMGNYQAMFTYMLPYDRKVSLSHTLGLPADAVVILSPAYLKIKGEGITDEGVRDVQGADYQMFSSRDVQPGDKIDLTISGNISGAGSGILAGSSTNIIVGLGALLIALIIGGVLIYRNKLAREEPSIEDEYPEDIDSGEDPETIMDAIIALDDLYRDGELPEDAYIKRRAELKSKLEKRVLDSSDD